MARMFVSYVEDKIFRIKMGTIMYVRKARSSPLQKNSMITEQEQERKNIERENTYA